MNLSAPTGQADVGLDLDRLVSASDALAVFRDVGLDLHEVEPQYLRFKRDGAIIAYRLEGSRSGGARVSTLAYVRAMIPPASAFSPERWTRLRLVPTPLGPGMRLLAGGQAALFLFPNDAGLRKLRFIADPVRLKRVLADLLGLGGQGWRVRKRRSAVTPVRYKPERRLVARAELSLIHDASSERSRRDMFLRLFRGGRGAFLERTARRLREAGPPSLVPVPLGSALGGRLFIEEAVAGPELFSAVAEGNADPEAVAEALAALHGADCDLGTRRPVEEILAGLGQGVETLGRADGRFLEEGRRLLRRLSAIAPSEHSAVPVHGDLHLHQVLLAASGPVLVDLERAGMGDPLMDLGELSAHLLELGRDQPHARGEIDSFRAGLEDAFARRGGRRLGQDLAFFTAAALVNRALLRYRSLAPGWQRRGTILLEMASAMVASRKSHRRGTATAERWLPTVGAGIPEGFQLAVVYPQREAPWPAFVERSNGVERLPSAQCTVGDPERLYGLYDPDCGRFHVVPPHQDPWLPSLSEWTRRGELVAYRVGRRATIRLAETVWGQTGYAKVLPIRKAYRLLARIRAMEAARAASRDARFPGAVELLEARPEDGLLIFRAVGGESLHELLLQRSSRVPPALDQAAATMAAVHTIDGGALGLRPARPPMSLEHYAALVDRLFPDRAGSYRDALRVVVPWGEAPLNGAKLIHADLHDKNVVPGPHATTLLDLDLLRPGDPAEDIGNLAAHLVLRALQRGDEIDDGLALARRLISSYGGSGGELDTGVLRDVVAATLFRLSCLYLFKRRWEGITPVILQAARRAAVGALV